MKLGNTVRIISQAIALALVASASALTVQGEPAAMSGTTLKASKTLELRAPAAKVAQATTPRVPAGQPVATLKSVEGNVLVSQESGLASADAATRLGEGSRVITTANSVAIVEYDDGCRVELEANQRLEIDIEKPCKERFVQRESILLEPAGLALAAGSAGAGGGAAAAVLSGSLGGAGLAAGAVGIASLSGVAALANSRQSVSPN